MLSVPSHPCRKTSWNGLGDASAAWTEPFLVLVPVAQALPTSRQEDDDSLEYHSPHPRCCAASPLRSSSRVSVPAARGKLGVGASDCSPAFSCVCAVSMQLVRAHMASPPTVDVLTHQLRAVNPSQPYACYHVAQTMMAMIAATLAVGVPEHDSMALYGPATAGKTLLALAACFILNTPGYVVSADKLTARIPESAPCLLVIRVSIRQQAAHAVQGHCRVLPQTAQKGCGCDPV